MTSCSDSFVSGTLIMDDFFYDGKYEKEANFSANCD